MSIRGGQCACASWHSAPNPAFLCTTLATVRLQEAFQAVSAQEADDLQLCDLYRTGGARYSTNQGIPYYAAVISSVLEDLEHASAVALSALSETERATAFRLAGLHCTGLMLAAAAGGPNRANIAVFANAAALARFSAGMKGIFLCAAYRGDLITTAARDAAVTAQYGPDGSPTVALRALRLLTDRQLVCHRHEFDCGCSTG